MRSHLTSVFILLAIFHVTTPGSSVILQSKSLSTQASEARAAGRYAEAIELYRKALQLQPEWQEGWWYLGTLLYNDKQYREARDCFAKLTTLDSASRGAVWSMLGVCEYYLGEHEKSVIHLKEGLQKGVDNEQLLRVSRYLEATLLTMFEQYGAAWEFLKELSAEPNESTEVIEAFGINLLLMPLLPADIPGVKKEMVQLAGRAGYDWAARRLKEARQEFAKLLERYPASPNVHYAYGAFLLSDDPDQALANLRRELEITPGQWPARILIANEYVKRGEYAQALPFAEEAAKLAPQYPSVPNTLGRVLLGTGDITRAIKILEMAVKQSPESFQLHYTLARAYTLAGRKDDAARARSTFNKLSKEAKAPASTFEAQN